MLAIGPLTMLASARSSWSSSFVRRSTSILNILRDVTVMALFFVGVMMI
jgi:hypothetical protein